jgi:hypothetical protein
VCLAVGDEDALEVERDQLRSRELRTLGKQLGDVLAVDLVRPLERKVRDAELAKFIRLAGSRVPTNVVADLLQVHGKAGARLKWPSKGMVAKGIRVLTSASNPIRDQPRRHATGLREAARGATPRNGAHRTARQTAQRATRVAKSMRSTLRRHAIGALASAATVGDH